MPDLHTNLKGLLSKGLRLTTSGFYQELNGKYPVADIQEVLDQLSRVHEIWKLYQLTSHLSGKVLFSYTSKEMVPTRQWDYTEECHGPLPVWDAELPTVVYGYVAAHPEVRVFRNEEDKHRMVCGLDCSATGRILKWYPIHKDDDGVWVGIMCGPDIDQEWYQRTNSEIGYWNKEFFYNLNVGDIWMDIPTPPPPPAPPLPELLTESANNIQEKLLAEQAHL